MIEWEKPNGKIVKTKKEPATIERAKDLGWVRIEAKKAVFRKPTKKTK